MDANPQILPPSPKVSRPHIPFLNWSSGKLTSSDTKAETLSTCGDGSKPLSVFGPGTGLLGITSHLTGETELRMIFPVGILRRILSWVYLVFAERRRPLEHLE